MALWPDLYPKIGNLDLLDKMMADMHRKRRKRKSMKTFFTID